MSLDDFLASPAATPRRRCIICDDEAATADALALKEGLEAGTVTQSIHFIFENYFRPTHGFRCDNTLRKHLRLCLGYNPPNRRGGGQ